ncbi:MAG: energy transducer TonB [Betaproteobacteria bacterium HGW-Betaproteobacteria-1]|jgi:protein TonB|nr:MAG: energy transducer TonB [Betaproteobacteria bacterium HGW-Betaproteobacteria-1]
MVSAVLHAVVIAAINFEPPDLQRFKDNIPALEIVLVNAKTESAPEKADALAQANLDRGGNTDEERRAKSSLPAPRDKPTETKVKPAEELKQTRKKAEVDAEAERQLQRVAELEKQAQALMTQAKSRQVTESEPVKQAEVPQPEKGRNREAVSQTLDRAALASAIADMARLEAQISKQQDEYQKRPKRKFVGARTQEYRFATYVEAWRQKVERVGNLNYPEAAREQKIYGQLRMTVSIKADGSLEKIEINQSSGHQVLDNAARRIVELAAPYSPFPEDIREDTDILSITRTWTFTRQDSLASD